MGIGTMAISVRSGFMANMNTRLMISIITILKMPVICSDIKLRMVSMSLVQRWIMSPVLFFICHENGRRSMCLNSVSLIVFTRVSLPFVLYTLNRY